MTFYDIVVLSSSPPLPPSSAAASLQAPPSTQQRVHMPATSPGRPSAPESGIGTLAGALKLGSRAVPVPSGASRGFATAGSLVKSRHFDFDSKLDLDNEFAGTRKIQTQHDSGESQEALKKPRTRIPKPAASDDGAAPKPKKPRVRKTKPNDVQQKAAIADGAATASVLTSITQAASGPAASPDAPPLQPLLLSTERNPEKPARQRKSSRAIAESSALSTTSAYFASESIASAITTATSIAAAAPPKKTRKTRIKPAETEQGDSTVLAETTNISKLKAPSRRKDARKRSDGAVSTRRLSSTVSGDGGSTGTVQSVPHNDDGSVWDVPLTPPHAKALRRPSQPAQGKQQDLELDEAVPRRQDWTPTKDTRDDMSFTAISAAMGNLPSNGAFTNMVSAFTSAYIGPQPDSEPQPTAEARGRMKKRPVELIDMPGKGPSSREPSPDKAKAPKKKARTITDRVLYQYAPEEQARTSDEAATATEFFMLRTTTTKVSLKDSSNCASKIQPSKSQKVSSSKASNASLRPKKPSAKAAAKPKMLADKLLSPASAISRLTKQDILFGTSSQLAKDESPTMIRQIQQAIRESEDTMADVVFGDRANPLSRTMTSLRKVEGNRHLWAAGTRDDDGQLLENDDDVHMPDPDRTQDIPLLMDGTDDANDSFVDIDDVLPPPTPTTSLVAASHVTPAFLPTTHDASNALPAASARNEHASFDNLDDYSRLPPSNQDASSSFIDIDDILPPKAQAQPHPPLNTMPPPLSTLATAVSSGSPIKKRRGRPPKSHYALPKPSLHHISAKDKQTLHPPSTPPKRKPCYADIEEILDSEDDAAFSPTPPRMSRFIDSQPLSLVPSRPALSNKDAEPARVLRVPGAHLEWTALKPTLFPRISAHIRSLPPTTDPAKPSWHEKILQYIPIVLEDLTAHLNANTGIRTYKKATVKQAKAWNKAAKADGGETIDVPNTESGDVLAVEKDLEVPVVQAWCQEMSICCMSGKDGKKWGGGKGMY